MITTRRYLQGLKNDKNRLTMKKIYILIWAAVMVACGGSKVNGNVSNEETDSIAVYVGNSDETTAEEPDEEGLIRMSRMSAHPRMEW